MSFLWFTFDFPSLRWLVFLAVLALVLVAPAILDGRLSLRAERGRRPGIERMHRRGRWLWRAAA